MFLFERHENEPWTLEVSQCRDQFPINLFCIPTLLKGRILNDTSYPNIALPQFEFWRQIFALSQHHCGLGSVKVACFYLGIIASWLKFLCFENKILRLVRYSTYEKGAEIPIWGNPMFAYEVSFKIRPLITQFASRGLFRAYAKKVI